MQTLYLIRGLPGAGKSSLADTLLDLGNTYHVEADMFFTMNTGNYLFDGSKLKDAHVWCQDTVVQHLINGYSVIVSNTSTTEKEVKVYQDIAKKYNARFISLIVENRHEGANIHGVPEEKLQQMRNRFSTKL